VKNIDRTLKLVNPDKYAQEVNRIKLEKAKGYPELVKLGRIQLPTLGSASGALPTPSVKPLPQVLTKPSIKGADFDYPYTPKG
jgi:hypothetical protein